MTQKLLRLHTPDPTGFQRSLVTYLNEQAGTAEATGAFSQRDLIARLRSFAVYVSGLDGHNDQGLGTLAICQRHRGTGPGFKPGRNAARLIVSLGNQAVSHVDVLSELVRATVEDTLTCVYEEQAMRASNRDRETHEAANAHAEQKIAEANGQLAAAEAAKVTAEARAAEFERELRLLRPVADLNGEADEKTVDGNSERPSTKKSRGRKSRRRKVEGAPPGVYETADGKYEIGWVDEKSKQRWKVIGTDLDEAIAARQLATATGEPSPKPAPPEPEPSPGAMPQSGVFDPAEIGLP